MDDIYFMKEALKEAKKALKEDEVPVGAVIVLENKIIAKAHNQKEKHNNAIHHAEIIALQKAYKKIGTWRLNEAIIYITLEPCLMCTGALIHSRIKKIIFGTKDPKGGALCSNLEINKVPNLNHKLEYSEGVLKEECAAILTNYFKNRRKSS